MAIDLPILPQTTHTCGADGSMVELAGVDPSDWLFMVSGKPVKSQATMPKKQTNSLVYLPHQPHINICLFRVHLHDNEVLKTEKNLLKKFTDDNFVEISKND